MEHSGNIPIFKVLGTLFGNIPQDFIGNFLRIFREYIMGIFHEYSTDILLSSGISLSLKKMVGYIISTINCNLRNGQLRDPDFTRHKLYHPNQYAYSQHPILWVVLNISTIILRTRLIRVQSQHPIKQVGLTIHSKTSLVRNSDNIKYKTQKSCNENQSLKSIDLL